MHAHDGRRLIIEIEKKKEVGSGAITVVKAFHPRQIKTGRSTTSFLITKLDVNFVLKWLARRNSKTFDNKP